MTRWFAVVLLLASASIAHATVITWDFDRVGTFGVTLTEIGSDGTSVLTLSGFRNGVPTPLVGKQDAPIDHGYGVGTDHNREIDVNEVLRLLFPAHVSGPVDVRLESVDGPLRTGEAWAIIDSSGTPLASGFGGGIVLTSVALPGDRRLGFTVPAGQAPDDYLVASVSATAPDRRQVSSPGTLMLVGGALVVGGLWRRRLGARP